MSDSAQKGRTSKQKSPKFQVLPEEQTNDQFDRLAGNVGTPEADKYNQKADEHQKIQDVDVENEDSEESGIFSDFDELDEARENLMALEREFLFAGRVPLDLACLHTLGSFF